MSQPQPTPAPSTKHEARSTGLLARLHTRLGDFWWYSLLMFAALRVGDVINAVVGLWLVPKYVPQEELGAVLPLTQFASTFALPISILVLVFTKFIAQFRAKGEFGKIKSLLRWFIGFVLVAALLSIALAKFTLPALFERIRIQDGSLTLLIIATGIVSTVSPVFNNALQGLQKFKTITAINLFSAPIRLITMLVALPIRALSGYMVGQLMPQIYAIAASCFSLRKHIDKSIPSVPFWKDDGKAILRYLIWVIISIIPGQLLGLAMITIIRQRLPDVESAAYYMISRFAELATYAGTTLMFVMFPLVVEAKAQGKENFRALYSTCLGTFAFGTITTLCLYVFGDIILNLFPMTRPYAGYSVDMALLGIVLTLQYVWGAFSNFETANNRFTYVYYNTPLTIIKLAILVGFSGYTYFYGILPKIFVDWMGYINLRTLRHLLIALVVFNVTNILAASIDHLIYLRKNYSRFKS